MQRLTESSKGSASLAAALHCARSRASLGVGTASRLTTSGTQPPSPAAVTSIRTITAAMRMNYPRSRPIIRQPRPEGNNSSARRRDPHVDRTNALALRQYDQGIDLEVAQEVAMVEIEIRQAANGRDEGVDIGRRPAAEAGEQLGHLELADHGARVLRP